MYSKARRVMTSRAAAKAFKDVGIDSRICRATVLSRMPHWERETTLPLSAPLAEETPTPSTPEEAKQLVTQMFTMLLRQQDTAQAQLQAQLQASLESNQRQHRMWIKKFAKFVDRLFDQQVLDQARIQELLAANSNKQHVRPGDRNQLSQARVLHQSDLRHLLAAREAQAQKKASKKPTSKVQAKGKQRAMDTQTLDTQTLVEHVSDTEESMEEMVLPVRHVHQVACQESPSPLPLPFPGLDHLLAPPLQPLCALPSTSALDLASLDPSLQPPVDPFQ
ncbi:uncharacterized protein SRS1_25018 [Sporisorium reilianum f. sp. reilianum]|uniref:Uncharacterized protein n=1 Tax=Sporisorium reilianum f. sp. reilianum TaxID=72559 RepID=A0A2N8UP72_9BASI|nr:uncharacterized protein SRS1_25018 [Sporisorium reilianum f. sp. reilianum]